MTVQGLRCARGGGSSGQLGADFLQGALGAGDAVHLGVGVAFILDADAGVVVGVEAPEVGQDAEAGVVLQFQTLTRPGIMGRSFRVLLLEREECL